MKKICYCMLLVVFVVQSCSLASISSKKDEIQYALNHCSDEVYQFPRYVVTNGEKEDTRLAFLIKKNAETFFGKSVQEVCFVRHEQDESFVKGFTLAFKE